MRRGPVSLLMLSTAIAPPIQAQVLRGTVVEEASRRGVAGSLIELIRGSDSIVASTTSGERGRFILPVVEPGAYRVRALRIGFQAWTSKPLRLSRGQIVDDTLVMPSVPVILDEIAVEAKSPCRSSPLADRRTALLWDEARTALGILRAGSSDSLEFYNRYTRRRFDSSGRLVDEQSWNRSGTGRWPVTSQAPESLASLGYVQPRDTVNGPVYFGPDATVFFSDQFLRTHCFRLVRAPAEDSSLIGVGFEPLKDRRTIDIAGTLWLDRGTRELRNLEYQYSRLWKWVPKESAGGALRFARLVSGQVVIVGWAIRAPVAMIDPLGAGSRREDERTRPFFGSGRVALKGLLEEIGEVEEVRGPDGRVLWRRES